MDQPTFTQPAAPNLKDVLRTSALRSRIEDAALGYPPVVLPEFPDLPEPLHGVHPMAEPSSSTAAGLGLLIKLLPAGLGAGAMVLVDPPDSKRELFARLFVAFAFSYLFARFAFDLLHSFSLFAFLDWDTDEHRIAVEGLCGAAGWFVLGGASTWLRKFRAAPTDAVQDATRTLH